MESSKVKAGRRGFLLGAGAAGAAGAAAIAAKAVPGEGAAKLAKPEPAPDKDGYRVTDHVRSYYRSTLV